ncbi:vWA domain-containing protein [Streptomyces chrestomyceticus]|uniref:VWA domain-containing protein n=1 Tax=Streptomyces chrestomyceticus TaxID=68185 RepID=A0ABU7X5S1_9ACTN
MGIRSLLRNAFGRSKAAREESNTAASGTKAPETATIPEAREEATPEPATPRDPAVPTARTAPTDPPAASLPTQTTRTEAASPAEDSASDLVSQAFDTPKPTREAEPEPVAKAGPEAEAKPEDGEKPGTETAKAEPETVPKAADEPKPETKPEAVAEAVPETKAKPEPAAKPEAAAEPEPVTNAEPETVIKAAPEPVTQPDPDATAAPEPATQPDPDATAAPAPVTATEPEATPEPAPEPEAKTAPEPTIEPAPASAPAPAPAPAPETEPTPSTPTSLTKVEAQAPALVSLYKAARVSLEKQGLATQRAAVYLVLDRSGSMRNYYKDGTVQHLAEQALGLSANLDDDGTVPVVFFSTDVDGTADLDLTNYAGRIEELHAGLGHMGRTNYHWAINAVIEHYEKSGATDPAFVIFQTDGAPTSKPAAEKALCEAAKLPIFWQFVGFGDPDAKGFDFLRKLDDLAVPERRVVDNAGFFHAGRDPRALADADLYQQLMVEFPAWLQEARTAGILPT